LEEAAKVVVAGILRKFKLAEEIEGKIDGVEGDEDVVCDGEAVMVGLEAGNRWEKREFLNFLGEIELSSLQGNRIASRDLVYLDLRLPVN
jgi:hypothetical protein